MEARDPGSLFSVLSSLRAAAVLVMLFHMLVGIVMLMLGLATLSPEMGWWGLLSPGGLLLLAGAGVTLYFLMGALIGFLSILKQGRDPKKAARLAKMAAWLVMIGFPIGTIIGICMLTGKGQSALPR